MLPFLGRPKRPKRARSCEPEGQRSCSEYEAGDDPDHLRVDFQLADSVSLLHDQK